MISVAWHLNFPSLTHVKRLLPEEPSTVMKFMLQKLIVDLNLFTMTDYCSN